MSIKSFGVLIFSFMIAKRCLQLESRLRFPTTTLYQLVGNTILTHVVMGTPKGMYRWYIGERFDDGEYDYTVITFVCRIGSSLEVVTE